MAGKKALLPAGCRILPCVCQHEFQDARYGKGMRVHNAKKSKSGGLEYGCTVCSRIHDAPSHVTPIEDKETEHASEGKEKVGRR